MDVNNAFLHGAISKDVYMSQPSRFIHPHIPNHICKLRKALYGLKQTPLAWYQELKSFVVASGFFNVKYVSSLFIYKQDHVIAYFLVYVDDLLLTGNGVTFLAKFKAALATKFSLKDLRTPSHFLGVELLPTTNGMFLSQQRCIQDILQKGNMID